MTSIGCCSRDDGDCSVAHRLTEQSGPETLVPGGKTTKFDDSGGTKPQACREIRLANAPG
jgi:hypothetical protein